MVYYAFFLLIAILPQLLLLCNAALFLGNNNGQNNLNPSLASTTTTATSTVLFSSPSDTIEEDNNSSVTTEKEVSSSSLSQALLFRKQAEQLRKEAEFQAKALQIQKEERITREQTKTDRWIAELFIQYSSSGNDDDDDDDGGIEVLNSVDQVFERLKDGRFDQEQVNKIFKRICETGPPQSRSKCSPIMTLLVDAVGKLDSVERKDNPNKRWNHRVERVLRKKLFAMDWGIELEDDDDDSENPWKIGSS